MPYRVTVTSEVAKLKPDGSGMRRRTVAVGSGRRTLVFSHHPVYLQELPPEVAQDSQLVVREVTAAEVKASGGQITDLLKAERIQGAEQGSISGSSGTVLQPARAAATAKRSPGRR